MTPQIYSFTRGEIKLTILGDGERPSSADDYVRMLINAPETAIRESAALLYPDPAKFMRFSYNCLLIETGKQRILADTGSGAGGRPAVGQVGPGLAAAGIDSITIDRVFITHCHGDHVNGLVDEQGECVFPNAELVMNRTEWDHWMGPEGVITRDENRAAILNRALRPYEDRLVLIKDGEEIAPGVWSLHAPGHTPGHTGLYIESHADRLIHLVDAMHTGVQIPHPEWSVTFDTDPDLAATTRRALLDRSADEDLLTMLFHFEFPGLGTVKRVGDGFRWEPVT
jgi:glyoxylase-like metal-dependent hydrolase (beta-lactamase superfamily II)